MDYDSTAAANQQKQDADRTGLPGSLTTQEWLTTQEAARYLGLSVGSLRNLTSNGQVPYCKLGRRNRYRVADLRALLLANKRGGLYVD